MLRPRTKGFRPKLAHATNFFLQTQGGTVFKWLKQKQAKEQLKLLYQNGAATGGGIEVFYQSRGDAQTVARLAFIADENHRIAVILDQTGDVSANDLSSLVAFNRELRRYFDESERGGGEARMRELMGQPKRIRDFDKTFQPMLGWDEYYKGR